MQTQKIPFTRLGRIVVKNSNNEIFSVIVAPYKFIEAGRTVKIVEVSYQTKEGKQKITPQKPSLLRFIFLPASTEQLLYL